MPQVLGEKVTPHYMSGGQPGKYPSFADTGHTRARLLVPVPPLLYARRYAPRLYRPCIHTAQHPPPTALLRPQLYTLYFTGVSYHLQQHCTGPSLRALSYRPRQRSSVAPSSQCP